jgi:hypothetical protein
MYYGYRSNLRLGFSLINLKLSHVVSACSQYAEPTDETEATLANHQPGAARSLSA